VFDQKKSYNQGGWIALALFPAMHDSAVALVDCTHKNLVSVGVSVRLSERWLPRGHSAGRLGCQQIDSRKCSYHLFHSSNVRAHRAGSDFGSIQLEPAACGSSWLGIWLKYSSS
jgi:hypothetical protein